MTEPETSVPVPPSGDTPLESTTDRVTLVAEPENSPPMDPELLAIFDGPQVSPSDLRVFYDKILEQVDGSAGRLRVDVSNDVYRRCVSALVALQNGQERNIGLAIDHIRALVDTTSACVTDLERTERQRSTPEPQPEPATPTAAQTDALRSLMNQAARISDRAARLPDSTSPPGRPVRPDHAPEPLPPIPSSPLPAATPPPVQVEIPDYLPPSRAPTPARPLQTSERALQAHYVALAFGTDRPVFD